jgi:hypothetical protein
MRLYISPAGKTALLVDGFLNRAKEEFGFDLAILLTDSQYINRLYEKFSNENVVIVPISDPLYGSMDYLPTIRRLVKQALMFCPSPEIVVINSSGGTEKMTNIIKDTGDILALRFQVKRVFGIYDVLSKDVVFTVKPDIDKVIELEAIIDELSNVEGE